jgi:hypothetical protein
MKDYQKHRQVLEKATRIDEYYVYAKYLKGLLVDNILVKLPYSVIRRMQDSIYEESISFRVMRKLGFNNSIFDLNEQQVYELEYSLDDEREALKSRVLANREILIRRRTRSGFNIKGEIL